MKNEKFSKDFKKLIKNTVLILRTQDGTIPEIGMGATTGAGSDRYPHTICDVANDLSFIMVQSDNHHATKDCEYYGNQKYTYSPNPTETPQKYTLRKNGKRVVLIK